MPEITMVEAINLALAQAMADDERVLILGEDVGVDGGVFRATDGLLDRFGAERVRDTPLAEAAIAGVCVGLAAQGFRPVGEIQFTGFIYPAIDQIVNHASRLRTRTRGRLSCPLVLRAPYGGGIHAPEHHSESAEAMFAHIPGVRVVIPSSPANAFGLLLTSIHNPDPVIFLEPKRIYRAQKQSVSEDDASIALDKCSVVRVGRDMTMIAWGAMMVEAVAAAEQLAGQGIEAEVIDVATLKPLDMPSISASVEKTGRCVIVHEAPLTGGFGAEISARLADTNITDLLAPIKRVAGYDTVMPLPKLEHHYMPTVERIVAASLEVMRYG